VRQLDAPLDLYRRPRSVFVADFIGSSTILRGSYLDGHWETPGLPPLSVPAGCSGARAIALRPEAISLLSVDDSHYRLRGTVSEVYFQGDHALAQVDVDGTTFLAAVRDDVLPERGATVGITWQESAIIPLVAD